MTPEHFTASGWHGPATELGVAELMATLSLATDLANGFPQEKALRTCLLAVGLGRAMDLEPAALSDVYYLSMLRSVASTCFAPEEAAAAEGDDLALRRAFQALEDRTPVPLVRRAVARIRPRPGSGGVAPVEAALERTAQKLIADKCMADCDVAMRLARRLRMSAGVVDGLGLANARWDGAGMPGGVSGEELPLPVRIMQLAHVAEIHHQTAGWSAAIDASRRHRGHHFDPHVVDVFVDAGQELLAPLESVSVWEAALAAEPAPRRRLTSSYLDDVAQAFADFTDLKSTYTLGHSSGVSVLAERAARLAGLGDDEVRTLRLAALMHDIGQVSVSTGIWNKPGPLSPSEWERVRQHAYFTERILSSAPALKPFSRLAGMHHERLDGSGYHRGAPAVVQTVQSRLLTAADVYHACTEARPHRPAMSPPAAAGELRAEVAAGRLDPEAVRRVLEAAGGKVEPVRASWPAGLTDREVEVLRLVAQGRSNSEVAAALSVSLPTVKHHVLHIYAKVGVTSRAGAALFAMEHDFIHQ
jgi:HD-GYP domain-containing protein (c-di-GMP phosphodiesterase class II)/DNA-binding CsgD family transcriptional regulator